MSPQLIDTPAVPPASPLVGEWNQAAEPPPLFTVSEWADQHRLLPETSAARGGRWRTSSTPYLRGIMDAVHEPGVRKIAVMGAAQVGKSEALHNILGYFIAYDACPMLFVHPTMKIAQEWSKERLDDMVQATEALRLAVDPGSTLDYKQFPGGYLVLAGANTPNAFARRACRIVMADDVDRVPPVVGDEGDPVDLMENRIRTFLDGLLFFVSTPTLKHGRIDTLYEHSDQRRFFLTCPSCGREDWTTWNDPTHWHVVYEGDAKESARLACPDGDRGGCGSLLDEPARRRAVATGGWRPTAVASEAGLVGFHLPAMVSTLGDVTLPRLVEKWLTAAKRGKESLRVFINTYLAEGWEERGARMNPHTLTSRREDYGPGVEVPAGAAVLTAGVDVQENRFELQVQAWGFAGERWVVDWRSINGDPKKPETRAALLEALSRKYAHAQGPQLGIHAACIDTGYATEEIYDFVLAYQSRRIFAVKGVGGRAGEPIVSKAIEKRRGRDARPVRLYLVNSDDAKGDIMGALSVLEPGPGYLHFPGLDTIDDEYFAQLCAEHRETRYNKAGVATHFVWVQDRDRNEALDTAQYCLAAFKLLNPNLRQWFEALGIQSPSQTPPAAAASPTHSTQSRWIPKSSGSWLRGR
jgi:phage terminase large subunit GpA-like protein